MSGRDVEGATWGEHAAAYAREIASLGAVLLFVTAFVAAAGGLA